MDKNREIFGGKQQFSNCSKQRRLWKDSCAEQRARLQNYTCKVKTAKQWIYHDHGGLVRLLAQWSGVWNIKADTAKRKLERLQFSTSSSFVKICSACSYEFKAYFWTFGALYHLLFDLETIRVNQIIIWWLLLEKKPK